MKKLSAKSIIMDDQVWKVHFTDIYMLVETRDGVRKRFDLLCIDTRTMKMIWKTEATVLGWWETIVAVAGRYIILSIYQDPSFPYTGGLKVMDLGNGNILWENRSYQLAEVRSTDLIRVVQKENDLQHSKVIKLETGEAMDQDSDLREEESEVVDEPVMIPSFYPEGHEYFVQVASFLNTRGYYPVKAIEYAETGDKVVIGFYEDAEGMLPFTLLVMSVNGEVFWEETTTNQRNGIGLGMYFLLKEWIVFVRDKKEIVILNLSI